MVVPACNLSYSKAGGRRISGSRQTWSKLARIYLKKKRNKKTGSLAQVLECLPRKLKALDSIPSTKKMVL
jgi:hypothetical protein